MKNILKFLLKIIKLSFALYLSIFIIGFIFPTHIRYNTLIVYETLSSFENLPLEVWISGFVTIGLVLWFGGRTIWKLLVVKGNLKKFWDKI